MIAKLLTKQLVLAATAVNIRVVDHLIVASGGTFSFRQTGLL
jgi:DNA repair protein RadC